MELSTIRVRVKASGHECLINADDFDPEVHEDASMVLVVRPEFEVKVRSGGDSEEEADSPKKAKGKK